MVWKSEAYQNLLVGPLAPTFFNSHPNISLSQPLTLLLVVQLTLSVLAADARSNSPSPPKKPVLHCMPPSHHYLHICQHPLCGQEATALLQRVRDEGGKCICVCLGVRCAFISMEAQSVCFVNKAQGECLLYLTYDTIWIDKKTARSGRALLGCGARGNAISFWCSRSAKQTLCAMPPG